MHMPLTAARSLRDSMPRIRLVADGVLKRGLHSEWTVHFFCDQRKRAVLLQMHCKQADIRSASQPCFRASCGSSPNTCKVATSFDLSSRFAVQFRTPISCGHSVSFSHHTFGFRHASARKPPVTCAQQYRSHGLAHID